MTIRLIRTSLAAGMLLLTAGLPVTAQGSPAMKGKAPATNARAKGKLKPVDINSATRNELGFMLGIPEELAAKIVAGRPYRSKAHLLTRNIVSAEVYAKIKDRVVAKQSGPVR
ncbi:ComEA family DNA-binding protein [Geothrix campi]|uniref:ComEA family DNA-binding protein n=1 Tax=Geothrix campi TaxID=2966450 RepID=UPI00214733B9|nr:helix-hairpin-helix domain-containing protein [Geothrix sp. SG10]